MIVIRLIDGMEIGNELFIYALYRKFKKIGKEVCIDTSEYLYGRRKWNSTYMEKVGLEIDKYAEPEKIYKYMHSRKIKDFITRCVRQDIYREPKEGMFDAKLLGKDNAMVMGYFQTDKYFCDMKEELQNTICFAGSDAENVSEIARRMASENSVAIHMRLSDYQDYPELYGGICTVNYYKSAIEYMRKNISNPMFYLFSDDIESASRVLDEGLDVNYKIVDVSHGIEDKFEKGHWDKAYLDIYLMSQCKHNIIANSSFSWWGAWLNKNSEKVVVAPKRWLNNESMPDVCPAEWIRL